jgi:hypothetical protein
MAGPPSHASDVCKFLPLPTLQFFARPSPVWAIMSQSLSVKPPPLPGDEIPRLEALGIVAENARVGLVIVDLDRRYAYANRAYAEGDLHVRVH